MATITAHPRLSAIPVSRTQAKTAPAVFRMRRMTPQIGRAMEMLGHAIEYLADEFALECMSAPAGAGTAPHPAVEAIELLKMRNRELYFACPEIPTLGDRLRSLLGLPRAN